MKAGISVSALSVLFIIAVSLVTIPAYSSIDTENIRRSEGFLQTIAGRFSQPNFYVVHGSIIILALFSLAVLCLIHYFFEKTQSQEVLFIAFFVTSLSCEPVRLMMPLQQVYEIPFFYLFIASRILLFGRYFGLFSLFAASIYAAGLETQRQRTFIFVVIITSLIIALGTPIDTFTWNTNFNAAYGYASAFRMLNAVVLLVTVTGFLVTAYSRGSREYVFIGIGTLLVFAGRGILINADSWVSLSGLVLLSLGAWFICSYLYKVYLWL
jgi:hypothetical protein